MNEEKNMIATPNNVLLSDVKQIVEEGLQKAYHGVNSVMLFTYWLVGQRIVKEEQHGEKRAAYGKTLLKGLANQLVPTYGTSYSERNLYSMRQFYLMFNDIEILNSRVQNLTWTHFRKLLRVTDDDVARYSTLAKNDQLFAAKYLTYMPTAEQLRKEIEREKHIFEQRKSQE